MVIYEVNHLQIQAPIYDRYRHWLDAHAREMLTLPGFVNVDIFECRNLTDELAPRDVCVHYHLRGQDDLNRYLVENAPRMRAEGLRLFPGGSRIVRRVLRAVPFDRNA